MPTSPEDNQYTVEEEEEVPDESNGDSESEDIANRGEPVIDEPKLMRKMLIEVESGWD